jgi:hypothetical protein
VRGTALIIRTEWGVRKLSCGEHCSFPLTENTLSHHKQQVNAVQVHLQDNTTCISTLYGQNSEHEQPSITWRMQTAERFGRRDRCLENTMQDLRLRLI